MAGIPTRNGLAEGLIRRRRVRVALCRQPGRDPGPRLALWGSARCKPTWNIEGVAPDGRDTTSGTGWTLPTVDRQFK